MRFIVALLIFSLIILFHELGHFLLAKKNGIFVEEFCLGLGPLIFGKQIGETFYSLHALPFGGACMMRGEDEESEDDRAFNNKSVAARISVVFAGPFFNFILAFVFSVILIGLVGSDVTTLSDVTDGSPAQEAGLQKGDTITRFDHKTVHNFREISYALYFENGGEAVEVEYRRDGKKQTAMITPEFSKETGSYRIGIVSSGYVKLSPLKTLQYSLYEVRCQIKVTILSLKSLVLRKIGLNEISGPVGIVSTIGDSYTEASAYGPLVVFETMINLIILLSANLGVMNLLPIPALDGGRLVLLIVEAVRGKGFDQEKEGIVNYIGLLVLLALIAVVTCKDIWTIIHK